MRIDYIIYVNQIQLDVSSEGILYTRKFILLVEYNCNIATPGQNGSVYMQENPICNQSFFGHPYPLPDDNSDLFTPYLSTYPPSAHKYLPYQLGRYLSTSALNTSTCTYDVGARLSPPIQVSIISTGHLLSIYMSYVQSIVGRQE